MKTDTLARPTAVILLLILIIAPFLTACHDDNDNNSTSLQSRPLTEREFANDRNLRANPEDGIVAVHLEPPTASQNANITGEVGFDVIPYRYNRTINHNFCFLNASDTEHSVRLQMPDGTQILSAEPDGECVSAVVAPGEYEVVLTHGQHVDRAEPVFLITLPDAQEFSTNQRATNSSFARFLETISNVFNRPANAQTVDANVTTLISTNSCVNCDLSGSDLTGNDLTFTTLNGADLSNANLSGVSLFEGLMIGTNFSGADLSNTDLRGSDMTSANMTNADLTGAFFDNSVLKSALFVGADITDASFDNASLVGAIWIDGGTCDVASIGMCNDTGATIGTDACDSITEATTDDGQTVYKCLLQTVNKETCEEVEGPLGTTEVCTPIDSSELLFTADLTDIVEEANLQFNDNADGNTPIAILAWGAEGGLASDDLFTSGGSGGESGFASTVTTLLDYQSNNGTTSFYYYLGEAGTLSNVDGDGGSSTIVMLVETSPSSLDDIILIAGGGAGGDSAGFFTDGARGGQGGTAASTQNGQGFIGIGQSIIDGADGGSTDGTGIGGNGTDDGQDGIGGQGGQGFLGLNSEWVNGDPDVGSDGRGGNADDSFGSSGGGGGGGGLGGGGAGDGEPGAGGGSFSTIPTITCNSAPNNDNIPSNPGTVRDSSFGNSNGAVEIWIFPNGCN